MLREKELNNPGHCGIRLSPEGEITTFSGNKTCRTVLSVDTQLETLKQGLQREGKTYRWAVLTQRKKGIVSRGNK